MEPHSRLGSSQNGTLRLPQALVLLLSTALAGPVCASVTQTDTGAAIWKNIRNSTDRLVWLLNPFTDPGDLGSAPIVGMVRLTAWCGIGSAIWWWSRRDANASSSLDPQHADAVDDAIATDPGLLKKFSTTRSYTVPATRFTYPKIRTFYRPHTQEDKLPRTPCPVPLLVFIHGLGGSAAQFNPVLLSLSNLGSCLAIDLPGCGVSSFAPKAWEAYTTESLVRLLAVVIEAHRAVDEDQAVILIGHSMGCSLAALLASPSSPYSHLVSHRVAGLIAICPQSDPPTEDQIKGIRTLSYMPPGLFSILRRWDRRNGIRSKSVLRMAGPNAEQETKKLQLRFNKQSRSAVWQRMALGMCPRNTTPRGGLPGQETWEGLDRPIFLIGGEVDQMTPVENVRRILAYLGRDVSTMIPPSEKASLPIAAAPFNPGAAVPPIIQQRPEDTGIAGSDSPTTEAVVQRKHQDSGVDASDLPKVDNAKSFISADANTTGSSTEGGATTADALLMSDTTSASTTTADIALTDATTPSHPAPYPHRLVVKSAIMPKPASHSLLFAPSTSRIISGLIGSFLADHIDPRLSLAWQLQYLSTEGKWDVKNLLKWRAVQPVSSPIANTFRAMKTLREVDETHTPKVVAAQWSGRLSAVIDISHDNPVYDPKGLEDGGILYQKFPTVSKQPPQPDEVQVFIDLVDKIRAEGRDGLIGVHCHYGFNRTGFFLVSYMVERLGYRVEDAIDEFQTQRPPGIRHSHFIDTLHVRYCRGLRKAPTL